MSVEHQRPDAHRRHHRTRVRRGGVLACVLLALTVLPGTASAAEGADIAVELTVVDDVATPQVFRTTIRNNGPQDATHTVVGVDAGGLTLGDHTADPRPASRDDGVGCQASADRLDCQFDRIPSGSSVEFTVEVEVTADGRLVAEVESAGTPDPNPSVNNTDSLLLRPATADLGVIATIEAGASADEAQVAVAVVHHGGRDSGGTLVVTGAPVDAPNGCTDTEEGWQCALEPLQPGRQVHAALQLRRPEPGAAAHQITFAVHTDGLADPDPTNDRVTVVVAPRDAVPGDVRRHQGTERIRTAVAVSTAAFPEGAPAAVLARADAFADALAGAPLAASVGGPILLTPTSQLSDVTAEELDRLLPPGAAVHLLGGDAALSAAVADAVAARGYRVRRVAGANRYQTSAMIAEALGSPTEVAFADGDTFPDAVVAAAAMAARGGALLLTSGERLPQETAAWASAARWAVGRSAARAVPSAVDLAGVTPAETSVVVATTLFEDPVAVGLATSEAFPDALAGGPLTALLRAPLLLSDGARLDHAVADYLSGRPSITRAHLFGGPSALSATVADQVEALLTR